MRIMVTCAGQVTQSCPTLCDPIAVACQAMVTYLVPNDLWLVK